jgi:hypothetical protein
MEKIVRDEVITRFFSASGKPVGPEELDSLPQSAKDELARMAAVELGVELEATPTVELPAGGLSVIQIGSVDDEIEELINHLACNRHG